MLNPRTSGEQRDARFPSDEHLVRACLEKREGAWTELVEKYKNLVFSIPLKQGLSREDAVDIFQDVWLTVLRELPQVREPNALAGWLIQVTARKCLRWQQREQRYEPAGEELDSKSDTGRLPDRVLDEVKQEQALRDAVARLSPRCALLVRALFFETPPRPYADLARELGIATGSVGFIRGRCLERLRSELRKAGFE